MTRQYLLAAAVVVGLTLLGAAVLVSQRDAGRTPVVTRFRGTLHGTPAATFTPCESLAALAVVDRSGGTLSRILARGGAGRGEPRYVEVRGRVEPPQTLAITDVRYAATETAGCRSALDDVVVRALGNEPFWAVTVSSSEIRFEAPDLEPVVFPSVPAARSGGAQVYETQTVGTHRLRLTLREAPCSDGMSDAYYALSASVLLDDRSFEGCAREGWR